MRALVRECDHSITLADGRALGFAEYGDPTGFPVFYFHGGLSSRIDATSAGPAASAAGVRVIAPDRPGIGLSDRHNGSSLLDWPRDVAELADQLGLSRFAVMGWSGGGAYSAACGYQLAEHVTSTTLIASVIPPNWPGMMEQINQLDRLIIKLSRRAGLVDEAIFHATRELASHAPQRFAKRTASRLCEQSSNAITGNPEEFAQATVAGLTQPAGVLDDFRIWDRPWGFDVAEIPGPVQVWHGDLDEFCPPDWGQRIADAIPTARLHAVSGAGHFVARDHWAEIFAAIAPNPGGSDEGR
ncbi:MAG: alpha/beta fold hydrolase [Candidatus Nanopelagicales bacterium]